MDVSVEADVISCGMCMDAKQRTAACKRTTCNPKSDHVVHWDIIRPMGFPSRGGSPCVLTMIGERSRSEKVYTVMSFTDLKGRLFEFNIWF